jgi:hypothetical protein
LTPVVYADVQKAVLAVAESTVGRTGAVALLKSFGATTGRDLKPEQYSDVITKAQQILGGV